MKEKLKIGAFVYVIIYVSFVGYYCKSNNVILGESLFNKNDFNGWTQKGGKAIYKIKNGIVTGESVSNTPNSFLISNKIYKDFILELDCKIDENLNSGIQIRSHSYKAFKKGRVHGYQIEVDPSSRSWSGGIYEEAGRGWLVTLENNEKARLAYKRGKWNHYRIEAIGDTIRTWINNEPAAYLVDNKSSEGFIGLQVHSIKDDSNAGKKVKWKHVVIQEKN